VHVTITAIGAKTMPTLYTTIGPWTFPTFNLVLTLAVLAGAALGLRRLSHPGMAADAYLGALAGAVIGARLFHVLLNWNYFAENLHEASIISLGGLDWHGGVLGGLIGLSGAWWLRTKIPTPLPSSHPPHSNREGEQKSTIPFYTLLDSLTVALPLIGLAAWWGCLAASCGYGLEVDNLSNYPAFAVAELGDVYGIAVPRYNTQVFGLILSLLLLIVVVLLLWRGWMRYRRFWLTMALLSAGMFVIGFFRGDNSLYIANLRADQILDAAFVGMSIIAVSFQRLAKE
jgi:phosphatidylglycerol:prolipoprotein diacylglycerol transferase